VSRSVTLPRVWILLLLEAVCIFLRPVAMMTIKLIKLNRNYCGLLVACPHDYTPAELSDLNFPIFIKLNDLLVRAVVYDDKL
jgi:hypothetical protein